MSAHHALDSAWRMAMYAPARALELVRPWLDGDNDGGERADFARLFARLTAATVCGRDLDPPLARRLLDKVMADLPLAQLRGDERRRLSALARGVDGMLRGTQRDLDGALAALDAALEERRLSSLDRHYLHVWRAFTLLARARPELAFQDYFAEYDYVRDHHPELFALLALNIGATLVHAGDWSGAEASLRQALALADRVPLRGYGIVCRANLVYCLIHTGRHDEARAMMGEALALDRHYVLRRHVGDVLMTVAEDLIETGFLDEAEAYLVGMMEEARGQRFGLGIATGHWCLGRLAWRRGQPEAALQHWRAALLGTRRFPYLTQGWKTMRAVSEHYASRGDWRRAWRWQRRFHDAHVQWEQQSASTRLAYAQAARELQRTRELSIRDPMTGLLNRRQLQHQLREAVVAAERDQRPLVVGMVDLDNLKPVNDRHGHLVGDQAIVATAQSLVEAMPEDALLFRFGGDEFCALLVGLPASAAAERFEQLLELIRAWRPSQLDERRSLITASVGLAAWPEQGRQPDALLHAADFALYRAKKDGGDRVVWRAAPPLQEPA